MTQEFHISITAVGESRFLVRTEQVAPGVPLAEEQVDWPVHVWLEQARQLMYDPLSGLLQGQLNHRIPIRSGESDASAIESEGVATLPTLASLGQQLYDALFHGMLRDSWLTAQGIAQHRREPLRLRLGLKDKRLQQVPWEILRVNNRTLATGTDLTFSRYQPGVGAHTLGLDHSLSEVSTYLKVLMVVASPDDQERLELRQEVQHLQAELQPEGQGNRDWLAESDWSNGNGLNRSAGRDRNLSVQVTLLEQPGRAELTQALEQGSYQILHYAGHSNLGETGGDLYLVSRQTGLTECLSGEDLAGLLVNNGIHLAVFNSCRSAYADHDHPEARWREQNLAQALVNRGVPSVIAMAERIPDNVAITFTQLLYRNLRQGFPIDLSLNRTRQGLMSAYGSDQFYWALPILYMHLGFDGYLGYHNHQAGTSLDALLFQADRLPQTASPQQAQLTETPFTENDLALEDDDEPDLDDDVDLLDELEEDQIQSYEADADVVSDLIQQLSQPPTYEERPIPASINEVLLPNANAANGLELYDQLLDHSHDDLDAELEADDLSAELTASVTHPQLDPLGQTSPVVDRGIRPQELISNQFWAWSQRRVWLGLAVGTLVSLGAVGLGWQIWSMRFRTPDPLPIGETQHSSLSTIESPILVIEAGNSLATNNLEQAAAIIQELLNRGDLTSAGNALNFVSRDQLTDPTIAFLRGRWQWESVKQGNEVTSLEDATRSWKDVLVQDDDNVPAYVALGFADYAAGNVDSAIERWNRAISLDKDHMKAAQPAPQAQSGNKAAPMSVVHDPFVLNAYAGLAIASIHEIDAIADYEQQQRLLAEARNYYYLVLNEDVEGFSPNAIGNQWIWQDPAIQDWLAVRERVQALSN